MKKQNLFNLFAMLLLAISFIACSNDDDNTADPENEEEEITRVELILTSQDGFKKYSKSTDSVEAETISLDPNKSYSAVIAFYNEDENVTLEIIEESDEHLVCFSPSGSNLSIVRSDLDENDKEIGIASNWTTTGAETGTVSVKLKHQPDLKSTQQEDCNIGGTDVDITFNYVVG